MHQEMPRNTVHSSRDRTATCHLSSQSGPRTAYHSKFSQDEGHFLLLFALSTRKKKHVWKERSVRRLMVRLESKWKILKDKSCLCSKILKHTQKRNMVRTCSLLFFSRALTKAILFGNEFNSHSCCSALPSDNTPELISCIILSVCFMVLLQEIRPEVYAPPIFAHCKNIRTETGNPTPFNFAQPNASLKIRALNKTFLSFYLLLPLPD